MHSFYCPEQDAILREVLENYEFPATLPGVVRYGQEGSDRKQHQ